MKNLLVLGDQCENYIDVEHVTFVGPVDLTIQHNINGASKTYWFMIVVDGKDVKISSPSEEKASIMRTQLVVKL